MKKLPLVIAVVALVVFFATLPMRAERIKALIEAYKEKQAAATAA